MDKKENYPDENHKELFRAILKLKNQGEAAAFFRDLLTLAELSEFANRWQMAKMIEAGKPYQEIAAKVRCSTTTVTRVAHWINHGMGGYKLALKRIKR